MNEKHPQLHLIATEVRTIYSKHVNQEYKLWISLPWDYPTSTIQYPVVYFLDAWAEFPSIYSAFNFLFYGKEIPGMIIVGISHDGDAMDWFRLRTRDYSPSAIDPKKQNLDPTTYKETGGGPRYLQFLTEELTPFMEKNYRVIHDDYSLVCHSFGATFGYYALFKIAGYFKRYILGSPFLWWDEKLLFKMENDYYANKKELDTILYTSIGAEEEKMMMDCWNEFCQIIKNRNYKKLTFINSVLPGETHMSSIPLTISQGLRRIFTGWQSLYPEQLTKKAQ